MPNDKKVKHMDVKAVGNVEPIDKVISSKKRPNVTTTNNLINGNIEGLTQSITFINTAKVPKEPSAVVRVNMYAEPEEKVINVAKAVTPKARHSNPSHGALFFSYDGINPVKWNGETYVDLQMLVGTRLLTSLSEVKKYMRNAYPNAELIASTGEWQDGINAGPIKARDVALTFKFFAFENQELPFPIVMYDNYAMIDWGDESDVEIVYNSYPTHVYKERGVYVAKLYGTTIKHVGYYRDSDVKNDHVMELINWGITGATSAAFPSVNTITYIDPKLDYTITNINSFLSNGAINIPSLDELDVSNVQDFSFAFSGNEAFNQRLTNWDTSSATNFTGMFMGATIAQPDVRFWNTSNVHSFKSMFEDAYEAIPDVRKWDTSNVRSIKNMFRNAVNARPVITMWSTPNLLEMSGFIDGAVVANPDFSNLNINNVSDMSIEDLEKLGA